MFSFVANPILCLAVLLVANGSAQAQDASLDTPFSQQQFLIHLTGTSTMDGYVQKDDYMLINTQPENGVWVSPDGMGGTFSNTVELLGGPFNTPREVCAAASGLPTHYFTPYGGGAGFDCAPPAPPIITEPNTETTTDQSTTGESQPSGTDTTSTSSSSNDWGQQISDWWDTSSIPEKLGAMIGVLGIAALLNAIWTWLFTATITLNGKMSTFGGPDDKGVGADEGLAIMRPQDVANFGDLFLSQQPRGTTGTARRLNPNASYIACRWDYAKTSQDYLRGITVTVTNPATGASIQARPVDWGPNANTGRVADLSPGAARALGLNTDQTCTVTIPMPPSQ